MKWFLVIIENKKTHFRREFATKRLYDIKYFLLDSQNIFCFNITESIICEIMEEFYWKSEVTYVNNEIEITLKEIE